MKTKPKAIALKNYKALLSNAIDGIRVFIQISVPEIAKTSAMLRFQTAGGVIEGLVNRT